MFRISKKTILFTFIAAFIAFLYRTGSLEGLETVWRDAFINITGSRPNKAEFAKSPVTFIDISYNQQNIKKIIDITAKNKPSSIIITFPFYEFNELEVRKNKITVPLFVAYEKGKIIVFQKDKVRRFIKNTGYINLSNPQPIRSISYYNSDINTYHIVIEALIHYYNSIPETEKDKFYFQKDNPVFLTGKNRFLINYQSKSILKTASVPFDYINPQNILSGKFKPESIKNKIIVIGTTNPFTGYLQTPVGFLSDSEIIAQAIYTIVAGKTIKQINPDIYAALLILTIFLFSAVNIRIKNEKLFHLGFLGFILGYFIIGLLLFVKLSLYLEITPLILISLLIILSQIILTREEQVTLLRNKVSNFDPYMEKALDTNLNLDWGEALLEIICRPMGIKSGTLLFSASNPEHPSNHTIFNYPRTFKNSSEEIEEMKNLKEPIIKNNALIIPLIRTNKGHYGALKVRKLLLSSGEIKQLAAYSKIAMITINNRMLSEKIQNSDRLALEADLAAKIQKALLSENPPHFPGVEAACRCISASEVGGDYFDFVTTPNNSIGIACGDVTGHGMAAALIMGLLRSVLRSQASLIASTGEVVTQTNKILYNDFINFSRMASLFYCTYDPLNKTIIYTNAGHNPPLVIRSNEIKARTLAGRNPILGFRKNIKYKEFRVKTYPKDVIVFMTDGIIEAEDKNKNFFGLERLERTIRLNIDRSPSEIIETVFLEISEFTEGLAQKDDMSLIILKIR